MKRTAAHSAAVVLCVALCVLASMSGGCGGSYGAEPAAGDAGVGSSDASPPDGPTSVDAAQCPAPRSPCGISSCTDLRVDRENCGTCGNACPADQRCGDGKCFVPGPAITFAIRKLYLGDTDRALVESATAWRQFGMNIDGLVTEVSDAQSPALDAVCKYRPEADPSAQSDGDDGIDNAFGKGIVSMMKTIAEGGPTKDAHALIGAGARTTLLTIAGWNPGIAEVASISGGVALGDRAPQPPKWNGEDLRPVFAATSSWFDEASISGYMFDSGLLSKPITLSIVFSSGAVDVELRHARVRMTLSADGSTATLGTLSGVIPTEDLITAMRRLAGAAQPELCGSPVLDSVIGNARNFADILTDGSQDPTQPCTALSVGFGFEAVRVVAGNTTPYTPSPTPCP